MLGEFLSAFVFYGVYSLFAFIGLAILSNIKGFKRNFSVFYVISKPLGILTFAFPVWLLFSMQIDFIKYTNYTLVSIIFIGAIVASLFVLLWRNSDIFSGLSKFKNKDAKTSKKHIRQKNTNILGFAKKVLLIEVICILLYFTYLYFRGFHSDIIDTERFMDLHLYTSAAKTEFFPFTDGWNSTETVNYYYYGYFVFGFINKILASFIPYTMGYHFVFGIIFANTLTLSFALVFLITKSKIFAFIAALLVAISGNFHYVNCIAETSNKNQSVTEECWYSSATRIILDPGIEDAYTINEFPMYSFLVGDLHPHVIAISFFLVALIFLYLILKSKKIYFPYFAIFIFLIANAFVINTWDFMTLGLLFAIIIFYKVGYNLFFIFKHRYRKHRQKMNSTSLEDSLHNDSSQSKNNLLNKIKYFFSSNIKNKHLPYRNIFILGVLSFSALISPFVLFFPFVKHYQSPAAGIGFIPSYIDGLEEIEGKELSREYQYPSTYEFLFGIWGLYIFAGVIFLTYLAALNKYTKGVMFVTFTFFLAVLLVIFTELFFVKELFHITNPKYFRANTVFKLGYHAFILFGLSFGIISAFVWQSFKSVRKNIVGVMLTNIVMFFIFAYVFAVCLYPYFAIKQVFDPYIPIKIHEVNRFIKFPVINTEQSIVFEERPCTDSTITNQQKQKQKPFTLDGMHYMCSRSIGDVEAIEWINTNVHTRSVILEAADKSYSYYGRIGVNTGMINVFNWYTHQWTWRFHYPEGYNDWYEIKKAQKEGIVVNTGTEGFNEKENDIQRIYETENKAEVARLVDKYNIQYIYIGNLEREKYTHLKEEKFFELYQNRENFSNNSYIFITGK